jgi:hypothetical protein
MDEAAAQNAPGTSLESDDSSVRLEAAFPSDSSDADVALEYDEHMDPLVSMKKRRERLWAVSGASSSLKRLRPHFTLVVCYLSCLTLRVPIFVSDLIKCVLSARRALGLMEGQPGRAARAALLALCEEPAPGVSRGHHAGCGRGAEHAGESIETSALTGLM